MSEVRKQRLAAKGHVRCKGRKPWGEKCQSMVDLMRRPDALCPVHAPASYGGPVVVTRISPEEVEARRAPRKDLRPSPFAAT